MDISGTDVDSLNSKEILELCNDILDTNKNEIYVLNNIDVNTLSDEKVQELYNDVMFNGKKDSAANNTFNINKKNILDSNYDIVDTNSEEIVLINGMNTYFDNISDDDILSLYNNVIDNDTVMLATTTECGSVQVLSYDYPMYAQLKCYDYYAFYRVLIQTGSSTDNIWAPEDAGYNKYRGYSNKGYCDFGCSGYWSGTGSCYSEIYSYKSYWVVYHYLTICK